MLGIHCLQFIDKDGKRHWKCLWCGRSFQHWNATKALLHVIKKGGGDIRKCSSKSIDIAHQQEYQRLLQKQSSKKQAQEAVRVLKKQSSDEYIVSAGAALVAHKQKKASPSTISATPSPSMHSHGQQKQSLLKFGTDTTDSMQQNSTETRYHQTKLGDYSDPQSEAQLTMAIADLIHSCGLPFSLASHHKFQRVLSYLISTTSFTKNR
jgi:hypothetical protein